MTYTIIGHYSRIGRLGVGITTYSLAVGGYCPSIRGDLVAVSSRAFANPGLRDVAMRSLDDGHSPAEVLQLIEPQDSHFDYHQVGIVDLDGTGIACTGGGTQPWAGHVIGAGSVPMGDSLSGRAIVQAMTAEFVSYPAMELAD